MSKITDIEKRYEQLEEAVAYLPTVEEKIRTNFIYSIQNEIHALSIEHKKAIKKIEEKKKPYVKFIPCTCGCNRRHLWCGSPCGSLEPYWYYECVKCGFKSDKAPSAEAAKLAWNEVMKDCHEQVEDFLKGDI